MTNPRIYLSPPHMSGLELRFVKEAFESNWIAPLGPNVDLFEKEFCKFTGAGYAVAVSSGTAALHLALILSGVEQDDEVLCSTFTFSASANAIVYQKAIPVFVDSDKKTWNMDPALLEIAIKDRIKKGKRPKAVIVVHLYGQSADTGPILEICDRYGVILIEDAAESMGATYKGKHTGIFGKMSAFSFNGNKIITTSGGGMFTSNQKDLAEKARFYATQARDPAPHYEHSHIGYNYRMSNILAGIGRGQLKVLAKRVEKRRSNFDYYHDVLSKIPGIKFMPEASYGKCNRWLTCLTIDPNIAGANREDIRLLLEKENIECRPLWKPMHLQPIFKKYPVYSNGVSEGLFESGLCLPSGSSLRQKDLQKIVHLIKSLLGGQKQ